MMEMFKVLQGKSADKLRNGNYNLGTNTFMMFEANPPITIKDEVVITNPDPKQVRYHTVGLSFKQVRCHTFGLSFKQVPYQIFGMVPLSFKQYAPCSVGQVELDLINLFDML